MESKYNTSSAMARILKGLSPSPKIVAVRNISDYKRQYDAVVYENPQAIN